MLIFLRKNLDIAAFTLLWAVPFLFIGYRDVYIAGTADDLVLFRWVSASVSLNESEFIVDANAPRFIQYLFCLIAYRFFSLGSFGSIYFVSCVEVLLFCCAVVILVSQVFRQKKLIALALTSCQIWLFVLYSGGFFWPSWASLFALTDPARHTLSMSGAFICISLALEHFRRSNSRFAVDIGSFYFNALIGLGLIFSLNDKMFVIWGLFPAFAVGIMKWWHTNQTQKKISLTGLSLFSIVQLACCLSIFLLSEALRPSIISALGANGIQGTISGSPLSSLISTIQEPSKLLLPFSKKYDVYFVIFAILMIVFAAQSILFFYRRRLKYVDQHYSQTINAITWLVIISFTTLLFTYFGMTAASNFKYRNVEVFDVYFLLILGGVTTSSITIFFSRLNSVNYGASHLATIIALSSMLTLNSFIFPKFSPTKRYDELSRALEKWLNNQPSKTGLAYYFIAHEVANRSPAITLLPLEYKFVKPTLWMGDLLNFVDRKADCITLKHVDYIISGPGKAAYSESEIEKRFGTQYSKRCITKRCKYVAYDFDPPASMEAFANPKDARHVHTVELTKTMNLKQALATSAPNLRFCLAGQ